MGLHVTSDDSHDSIGYVGEDDFEHRDKHAGVCSDHGDDGLGSEPSLLPSPLLDSDQLGDSAVALGRVGDDDCK